MEKNHKIITEFMEYVEVPKIYPKDKQILRYKNRSFYEDSLEFDKDWNLLMEVVEKIKQFLHNSIKESLEGKKVLNSLKKLDIQYTYKTCVEFINFYNKQKEE